MTEWWATENSVILWTVAFILYLLLVILTTANAIQIWSMKNRYKKMMGGLHRTNIEEALSEIWEKLNRIEKEMERKNAKLALLENTVASLKGRLGFIRYNAFGERGNDLSFSMALLDEKKNGVVLSGIYGREESYVFAKPVENGESRYTLTPEEKEAIQRSQNKE